MQNVTKYLGASTSDLLRGLWNHKVDYVSLPLGPLIVILVISCCICICFLWLGNICHRKQNEEPPSFKPFESRRFSFSIYKDEEDFEVSHNPLHLPALITGRESPKSFRSDESDSLLDNSPRPSNTAILGGLRLGWKPQFQPKKLIHDDEDLESFTNIRNSSF